MRRPVCGRDAVRGQVIDALEARIKRRPAMKKISTAAAKQSRKMSEQKLAIGLDLGDRSSWVATVAARLERNSVTNQYQNQSP
jgi:hypothetical protein